MRKLLISGIALAGMLLTAGAVLATTNATQVKAVEGSVVKGVVDRYLTTGQYTKKTQIFMTDGATEEMKTYFHAGHNVLERTTYYDENVDALLMGNYDGSFGNGTTGVNSGYRYDSEANNMAHYFYEDYADPNAATLFTAHKDTYVVPDTMPSKFFETLSDVAFGANEKAWSQDGDSYFYDFEDFDEEHPLIVDGAYSDPFLTTIQYFTAPMLLTTDYFTPKFVRIQDCSDWLSIRLYVDPLDEEKVTVKSENKFLLSEARVFKGLTFTEPSCYLKGGFNSWGTSDPMAYYASAEDLIQYRIDKTIGQYVQFGIDYKGDFYKFDCLENQEFFQCGDPYHDRNIETKLIERSYTIYFKPLTSSIYIGPEIVEHISLRVIVPSDWYDHYKGISVYTWRPDSTDQDTWPGVKVSTDAKETTIDTTVSGYRTCVIICGLNDDGSSAVQTIDASLGYANATITIGGYGKTDGKLSEITVTRTAD